MHAQDGGNLHILCMLKGTLSLDMAQDRLEEPVVQPTLL